MRQSAAKWVKMFSAQDNTSAFLNMFVIPVRLHLMQIFFLISQKDALQNSFKHMLTSPLKKNVFVPIYSQMATYIKTRILALKAAAFTLLSGSMRLGVKVCFFLHSLPLPWLHSTADPPYFLSARDTSRSALTTQLCFLLNQKIDLFL